jgi:hypothetical protein
LLGCWRFTNHEWRTPVVIPLTFTNHEWRVPVVIPLIYLILPHLPACPKPGTINKTDWHHITEILLKMALNTITLTLYP